MILGGDFNIQLDKQPEKSRQQRLSPTSYRTQLLTLLDEYHLADAWKLKNPKSTRGTFHRQIYSARLDYLFISEFLILPTTKVAITPEPLSDHSQISIYFKTPSHTRGPGYWRMNNFLLADQDFTTKMRQHIIETLQEDLQDPHLKWEWTKYKIRSFAISYGIEKARKERNHTALLEKRLLTLAEEHDLTATPDIASEVQSIKRELAEIQQQQANKTIFRTKANWTQMGEKPTAYFLGMEKRRG